MIIENTYLEEIESRCRSNGILLDTSLLLVVSVGMLDEKMITRFKLTHTYSIDEFRLLFRLILSFKPCYVSPHILAELSNHAEKLGNDLLTDYYRKCLCLLKEQLEVYVPKDNLLSELNLPQLGFTDASILKICLEKDCVAFTADGPLTQFIRSRGLAVLNINEIRTALWFRFSDG
jgi:rRNA-processing protein FCF1